MKKYNLVVPFSLVLTSTIGMIVLGSGCSTFSSRKSGEDIASNGPTVLTVKADPSTVDLDQNLRPKENAMVFADVKDFQSNVQSVRLRFIHVPLDLPMKRVAGSTWEADLTPAQLKELAVSGQTMRYQANVIATNESGQTGVSASPVDISVRAPEPKQLSGVVGSEPSKAENSENEYQRDQRHVEENNGHASSNQPGIRGSNNDTGGNDHSRDTYPSKQPGENESADQP